MKKLNLAIIGQGRSGRDIHGAYYRSERNAYFNIKYVVDLDARRREEAPTLYPGCIALSDYRELYNSMSRESPSDRASDSLSRYRDTNGWA